MSAKAKVPQTGDNANKGGAVQKDKFDYRPGDIEWIKPPKGVNAGPETATPKKLSRGQARDLARRIKAKLARQ